MQIILYHTSIHTSCINNNSLSQKSVRYLLSCVLLAFHNNFSNLKMLKHDYIDYYLIFYICVFFSILNNHFCGR